MDDVLRFTCESDSERLDQVLADKLAQQSEYSYLTRSQIKKIIEGGFVTLNDVTTLKAGTRVKQDTVVEVVVPPAEPSYLVPYDYKLDIVYEDNDLIVVNKPADLVMHPGAGNKDKTLANALIAYAPDAFLKMGLSQRPGIVHRLDKDTTGLVVVAKNLATQNSLSQQFSDRAVERRYMALCLSTPRSQNVVDIEDAGVIDQPIGRHPDKRTLFCINPDGQKAITNWKVLERFPYANLLELKLETGRTHQIRVHLESISSPVLGDQVYGNFNSAPKPLQNELKKLGRQALHAFRLGFTHPATDEKLSFNADAPEDFKDLLNFLSSFS